ncbi:hypothetical protein DFH07DRAFT_776412 [Mycena maculata]|uniref:Uncharacterized protein n=1 Tax=Mycena maculata TaxID=230809 RepID=A0AAD7INU5_9AGAR|nr:hypothetical protein DFH07DRAFT_776412 [Mycena maculata]
MPECKCLSGVLQIKPLQIRILGTRVLLSISQIAAAMGVYKSVTRTQLQVMGCRILRRKTRRTGHPSKVDTQVPELGNLNPIPVMYGIISRDQDILTSTIRSARVSLARPLMCQIFRGFESEVWSVPRQQEPTIGWFMNSTTGASSRTTCPLNKVLFWTTFCSGTQLNGKYYGGPFFEAVVLLLMVPVTRKSVVHFVWPEHLRQLEVFIIVGPILGQFYVIS